MTPSPLIPSDNNLSIAWARAFLAVSELNKSVELSPLVVTVTDITDGVVNEHADIRNALDTQLLSARKQSCHTVANTIFPSSLWNANKIDGGADLFSRFERTWPKIHQFPANSKGHYFRRMTAYEPAGSPKSVNQLEHITCTFNKKNHRRSALQAAIFDPTRDHNHSRIGRFPCLHQVAFLPLESNGLCVTAFYPMHYLFERAYGNYLGLCRLGKFMAVNMGLKFTQLVCVSSVAKLDDQVSKNAVSGLRKELARILAVKDGK
ncbi:MAG: thymidylate synthase [Candidatus Binatia bacterium]